MITSFLIFFVLFTLVGLGSALWRKSTIDDYFLASRKMPSWLVALSFGATISSGATFIGFAGLAYQSGMSAIYAIVGLMIGDHIGWEIAKDKIRQKAKDTGAHTYPSLIGKLSGGNQEHVTFWAAVLTVIFLGAYCAAQLVAGAKVGATLFEVDYNWFVGVGAVVLLAYCWAGGIRASIWTDAVQAIIIIFSLLVLIAVAIDNLGGMPSLWDQLQSVEEGYLNPFRLDLMPLLVGWIFFGVGILAQPQLMVRHMVAQSEQDIKQAKIIYFVWRWIVLCLACSVGFIARVMIPPETGFDPELSIPALWQDLLPPVLVGFLIAGLFSATMSTADSLLLSASSAFSQHIVPQFRNSYGFARLGTVLIMGLIVLIALFAPKGVLNLVVLAWAGLGSAIGPLIIVQLCGTKITQRTAITMMISGFLAAVLWRYWLGLHTVLMDLVPGMLAGFAVFAFSRFYNRPKNR